MTTEKQFNVNFMRQDKILNPEKAAETFIVIGGMGTVGSWAAHCLARAGFKKFLLIDFDTVEQHNLPSQAFPIEALGQNKAWAMAAEMERIADNLEIEVRDFALEGGERFSPGILISAVDSMEMRKLLFEHSAKDNRDCELFMDFRMGGNIIKGYAFDPNDKRRQGQYAGTLYSQEEGAALPCGTQTFAPVGPLVGSFITQMVTQHVRDGDHPPYHVDMDFNRFSIIPIGLPKQVETSADAAAEVVTVLSAAT